MRASETTGPWLRRCSPSSTPCAAPACPRPALPPSPRWCSRRAHRRYVSSRCGHSTPGIPTTGRSPRHPPGAGARTWRRAACSSTPPCSRSWAWQSATRSSSGANGWRSPGPWPTSPPTWRTRPPSAPGCTCRRKRSRGRASSGSGAWQSTRSTWSSPPRPTARRSASATTRSSATPAPGTGSPKSRLRACPTAFGSWAVSSRSSDSRRCCSAEWAWPAPSTSTSGSVVRGSRCSAASGPVRARRFWPTSFRPRCSASWAPRPARRWASCCRQSCPRSSPGCFPST